MDKDLKGFKEIYRTLKKGGKALIVVHGEGGIINDLTMKIIRPKYNNDRNFKRFIDSLLNCKFKKHKNFLIKNYDKESKRLFMKIIEFLDNDILLTMKDRILAPKYKTYNEKNLKILLKRIGFKKIYRIKKKVSFFNIRRLLAPIYHHYDNEISRALYGDGIIHLVVEK
jgi:SAM-dependent methyltransferase